MTETKSPKGFRNYRVNSWIQLIDCVKNTKRNPGSGNSSAKRDSSDWAGTSNLNEALDLAVAGWEEGTEIIKKFQEEIADQLDKSIDSRRKVEIKSSVQGGAVNIGRFLVGHPQNMIAIQFKPDEIEKDRYIKISVQCLNSCGAKNEAIIRRGAAVVALTDELEKMGYRVEIDAIFHSRSDSEFRGSGTSDYFNLIIPLKRSDEPISIAKLAFVFGHPASTRRIYFGACERFPNVAHSKTVTGYAYGSVPKGFDEELKSNYDVNFDASTLLTKHFNSDENATKWLVENIDTINKKFGSEKEG